MVAKITIDEDGAKREIEARLVGDLVQVSMQRVANGQGIKIKGEYQHEVFTRKQALGIISVMCRELKVNAYDLLKKAR